MDSGAQPVTLGPLHLADTTRGNRLGLVIGSFHAAPLTASNSLRRNFATSLGLDIASVETLPRGKSDHLPILVNAEYGRDY